jgi:hypothetical protein
MVEILVERLLRLEAGEKATAAAGEEKAVG